MTTEAKKPLLAALCNEPRPAGQKVPAWLMRQAGRYLPEFRAMRAEQSFFTVCQTPSLACEVTLQPLRRYEGLLDAAIIFSDILVIPQALGMNVEMVPGKGPILAPIFDHPAQLLDHLMACGPFSADRLAYVYDALQETRKHLSPSTTLLGFAGAPWTLFAYMAEGGSSRTFAKSKSWLLSDPASCHAIFRRLTDAVVSFLDRQLEIADAAQVFDSWAGELSPHMFRIFAMPYLLEIGARLAHRRTIVFAKGANNFPGVLDELASSHYTAIALDWTVDLREARRIVRKRKALQGNLDPVVLFAPAAVIRDHVQRLLLEELEGDWDGFVFNLGHGLMPEHDPEHVLALLQAIREVSQSD